MMGWEQILKERYQEDMPDEKLLKEAIKSCEFIFDRMDKNELFNHSRTLAMCYLALKRVEKEGEKG
jgi:hypothetical protein